MGVLMNGSLNVSKLPKDKLQRAKNGDLYYNFTMRIEDETGKYGNNAGMWDQQTKEERDAKTSVIVLEVGVRDRQHLASVVRHIRRIKSVMKISRIRA